MDQPADHIRSSTAYEAVRADALAQLAREAESGRVQLAPDLVLVFTDAQTAHAALEELIRAERVTDAEAISAESRAFEDLHGGERRVAALLYVDITDPVELADRLTELTGITGGVFLDIGGRRVPAVEENVDGDTGAFPLLFEPDAAQRAALLEGALLAVVVDHPACRVRVALTEAQARAATSGLRA